MMRLFEANNASGPLASGRQLESGQGLSALMRGALLVLTLLFFAAGCGGPEEAYTVPGLTKMLQDSDPMVRYGAAYALAAIGLDAESALPALAEALRDQDVEVRLSAVYAISMVGIQSPAALPAMQSALQDGDERVRDEAAQAVRRLEAAAKYRPSGPPATDQTDAGRVP